MPDLSPCPESNVFCAFTVNRVDNHNHPVNNFAVRRGIVLKKLHHRIASNPSEPVRRVFDAVVASDSGDSDELPQFDSVRSRAKRVRANFMPPIPRNIADVAITGEWIKTWKSRQFLSHIDNNIGVAIFTTKKMLKALQKANCIYIDGTFHTAPKPYQQFLTIHGKLNGFVIPLVFVLVTGKLSFQYRRILQHVKQRVQMVTGNPLAPIQIVCDFEKSLHIALQFEFPRSRLCGCNYHFGQSLWRKLQANGLTQSYRDDCRFRKLVRKFMTIGFLPTLLVRQNFNLLCASRRVQRKIHTYPRFDNWINYMRATYINQNAVFPPTTWNVHKRNSDTRTNNHVEGMVN